MFQNNSYAQEWKITFVHFIPKPNSDQLRPIALTSCISKLFETIITTRLQLLAEQNYRIPESQSGFRKGKSCVKSLCSLYLNILLKELANIRCSKKLAQFFKFIIYKSYIHTSSTFDVCRKTYIIKI